MSTLRLVWPQWQGMASSNMPLLSDLPTEKARQAYAVGTRVLDALLETPDAIVEHVPVPDSFDSEIADGIESKAVLLQQLRDALAIIEQHNPERILTIGGDCSVSGAPFAAMAQRYRDDLAVIWVDTHPDLETPETGYGGYHAQVLSHIIGKGDTDTLDILPGAVEPSHVAIAGLLSWRDTVTSHLTDWGVTTFSPEDVREDSTSLIEWLKSTGCSKVAIHFDVDVVDSSEIMLGLAGVEGGLTLAQASRMIHDVSNAADVVALTVAEYIPRQVIRLVHELQKFPLIK